MRSHSLLIVTLVTLAFGAGAMRADGRISYPEAYREWAHVKSAIIEPGHPYFDTEGGIHHIYANAAAREGYRSGVFRDGAVIVYELLELTEAGHVRTEGPRRRVDVMLRDEVRYASTGGWGFERFIADDRQHGAIGDKPATACFACHQRQAASSFVFSSFRQ